MACVLSRIKRGWAIRLRFDPSFFLAGGVVASLGRRRRRRRRPKRRARAHAHSSNTKDPKACCSHPAIQSRAATVVSHRAPLHPFDRAAARHQTRTQRRAHSDETKKTVVSSNKAAGETARARAREKARDKMRGEGGGDLSSLTKARGTRAARAPEKRDKAQHSLSGHHHLTARRGGGGWGQAEPPPHGRGARFVEQRLRGQGRGAACGQAGKKAHGLKTRLL